MARRPLCILCLIGLLSLGVGLLGGCSGGSQLESANAGRSRSYEPGLPNFDMEAIVTWEAQQPGIDLYLSVPPISLIFVNTGQDYVAAYEAVVRLLDRRGRDLILERALGDTVRVRRYEETQAFVPLIQRTRLDAPPGAYLVEVVLTDLESDKQTERRQIVEVVGPEAARPALSAVLLAGRRAGQPFEPVVSLHVPAGMDSLRAFVELQHVPADAAAEVTMRLLQYPADTSVAIAPYWLAASFGSLAYRGVQYERPDTLQVSRRPLADVEPAVEVAFSLPALTQGVYRVQVETRAGGGTGPPLRQERDLVVTSETFPRVVTLEQMIEALPYIAYEREVNFIRAGETPAEKKRRFDAFWGSLVSRREVAANLLKLYYGRIEEANLLFTTHKEGWKTDRGMLYVVLGAPVYVESRVDGEVWHYTYGDYDPFNTYTFERVRVFDGEDVFENYVLQRRPYYEQPWLRAMDRWRSGTVL